MTKNDTIKNSGRKTKQPKVIPDQSELDAELDAYNKGREKKAKQESVSETADPLNDSKDDDILKDSKRMLFSLIDIRLKLLH